MVMHTAGPVIRNPYRRADDLLWRTGTDGDIVSLNRSTTLAANTALTDVLEGTPVTPVALAANSLILSNITDDGDILIAVSKAGTSYMAFMADASTGDTLIGVTSGQSFDIYVAGTKEYDFSATELASTGAFTISTTAGALTLSPTGNLVLKDGLNFIGDTANANMTVGVTINQGANDNSILAFKSSDIATGLATALLGGQAMETDDFLIFSKASATLGGFQVLALGENDVGQTVNMQLGSIGGQASTTRTTAGRSLVEVFAVQHNGSDVIANVTTDGNIFGIRMYIAGASTTRFMFDAEGSGHADVEWVAFDTHNDLALLDAFQYEMGGRLTPVRYGANSLYYNRGYLESMGIVGKDSWHTEQRESGPQLRSMVNFTKLAMLHHGALLQVGDQLKRLKIENLKLKKRLLAIEGGA